MNNLITKFEEIVNVNSIGSGDTSGDINEILKLASRENLKSASKNLENILVLGIDFQKDFMENGALPVPNSFKDIENFTRFIYNNIDKISEIDLSMDTHTPRQIFFAAWWIDQNGNHPGPNTIITSEDISNGKWLPVFKKKQSINYVEQLKILGKRDLIIWPYHCLQGTTGCALENQLSNIAYFFSIAKTAKFQKIMKGIDPLTEMYGFIKGEYDENGYINTDFLNKVQTFDKIIIGGEAKSHCVLESIKQILEYYANSPEVTSKIYILEDCMSPIPTYEQMTENAFQEFKTKYKVNIVKSTDLTL